MLPLDDPRWSDLEGGYRRRHDPRATLALLRAGTDDQSAWDAIWNELHHQGAVGIASYAAVPHLVDIHRTRALETWQTYSFVGTVDLCRTHKNPPLPSWLAADCHDALQALGRIAVDHLARTTDRLVEQTTLGIIALTRGLRNIARAALELTNDELTELFERE